MVRGTRIHGIPRLPVGGISISRLFGCVDVCRYAVVILGLGVCSCVRLRLRSSGRRTRCPCRSSELEPMVLVVNLVTTSKARSP